MIKNNQYQDVLAKINDRTCEISCVTVWCGYLDLHYSNPAATKAFMCDRMMQTLTKMQEQYTYHTNMVGQTKPPVLYVVAGATADGIGMCYDVADDLKKEGFAVETVGIVSSAATIEESWGKALPDAQAERLDHLVIVDMPANDWNVIVDGKSLMVDVGFANVHATEFVFLGGGAVANNELNELSERLSHELKDITVTVRHGLGDFAPKADKALKKYNDVMDKQRSQGADDEKAREIAKNEINGTRHVQEGSFMGTIPKIEDIAHNIRS